MIDVEDVAKAWNGEFHRMHNKIFVQWNMVDKEMNSIEGALTEAHPDGELFKKVQGTMWSKLDEVNKTFEKVLLSARRL